MRRHWWLAAVAAVLAIVTVWHYGFRASDPAIERLRSESPSERIKAVEALGRSGSPAASKALAEAAQDADPAVASRAVIVLGHLGHLDDLPLLQEASKDSRASVREAAVVALGRFAAEAQRKMLRGVLASDPAPTVRAAAARGLGMNAYWPDMPYLLDALEDPSEAVRRDAGAAVRRIWQLDFGFRANDPPEARRIAVAKIRWAWEDIKLVDPERVRGDRLQEGTP